MFKSTSKFITTAAAAGLAFAPIAVQANTRAADSAPVYTSASAAQPGLGRSAEGEDVVGVPGVIIGIFAAAAVIGAITIAASEDDEDTDPTQSPGT
ncbi:hypothetical protein EH31_16920 [Erythrobacter longus]|uniref:Uncharacterized protein n=1 Tax=Erythrobacter longus TaxID=1044 RepID=A0A074MA01_ERYLO|nr:hypothetical protein [Erythrobacter longus]KEO88638.1 hypothetical protein EH31_16920 [Erythrobacter longus]